MIEKDRAEGEERGGESEGERGEECGKFLSIGEIDSDSKKENATGGREDADAENGGEPEVEVEDPPLIGVDAEGVFDVKNCPISGKGEERGAWGFIGVEVASFLNIRDIARGGHAMERFFGGGLGGEQGVDGDFVEGIDPVEGMDFVVELVIGVRERDALELIGGINAEIDEEVIDGEATFFGDRANFGEAGILVPAAALMEIGKGKENREEEKALETRETEHKWRVSKGDEGGDDQD